MVFTHTQTQHGVRTMLALSLIAPLSGCAAAGAMSAVAQIASLAMNATGMSKPADPNATSNVQLKIVASNTLNTDNKNHPFSVVVRIYQLKQSSMFQQAFYNIFLDSQREKEALGSDIIAVKDITLIPGQIYVNTEKVAATADYVGIVALFHAPAAGRWKLIFPTRDSNKTGLTLGMSECSITVATGNTLEYAANTQNTLKIPATCS